MFAPTEAAARLGVSTGAILRLLRAGRLGRVQSGQAMADTRLLCCHHHSPRLLTSPPFPNRATPPKAGALCWQIAHADKARQKILQIWEICYILWSPMRCAGSS